MGQKPRKKSDKDEGCCSINFLKYVLFIFNILFFIAGLCLIGVGLWTWFAKHHYIALLATKTYAAVTYLLLGAGVLIIIVGIVGCIGSCRENRGCLLFYAIFLVLIFLIEAAAGVLAYVYSDQVEREVQTSLRDAVLKGYSPDHNDSVTVAVATLHEHFTCCGATDFKDWENSTWYQKVNTEKEQATRGYKLYAPSFCCITPILDCGRNQGPSNIYYDGCMFALRDEIKDHEILIGSIVLGVSSIQIFGAIMACCLYSKLKYFVYEKGQRAPKSNTYYYHRQQQ